MTRTAFLDLNGTLVAPVLVERLDELHIIPGAPQAIATLSQNGFRCPVVTVQSRIEKGLFTAAQFRHWFDSFAASMKDQGAQLEGPYVCPHRYRTPCACKKPNTLLYERAAREGGLQLAGAFVIGDESADMEAASRFGGIGCLVSADWAGTGQSAETVPGACYVGRHLADVVAWVLAQSAL